MRVTIYPSKAVGEVMAPPSKSVAHRALICGALTDGCTVRNVDYSQDIAATLCCLEAMGAEVNKEKNTVSIGRLNPFEIADDTMLDCGESGSTLRFLLPLCLLSGSKVSLRGHGRLMQRPLAVYENLCREQGFLFEQDGEQVTVCGHLQPGIYHLPGDVSSQFITGMLFALSLLEGESCIVVDGKLESSSYIDITCHVMKAFGVAIVQNENVYTVLGNRGYECAEYAVEGDCSNAAFLDGFNQLGGAVKLLNFTDETPQGDRVYRHFYNELKRGQRRFDLSDCPDLGPVLFALAAALGGADFTGTARLRLKESDRCAAMAQELAKFGIETTIGDNSVTIHSGTIRKPEEPLSGHNDHRVVMALSLLCSLTGGTIMGAEAVAKSFPQYFDVIKSLGIELKQNDI